MDSRSVIVRFKKKDQRSNRKADKTELLGKAIGRMPDFVNAKRIAPGASAFPRMAAAGDIAFDIDQYETPFLVLSLSAKEIAALRKSPDVDDIEDDGRMYALAPDDLTGVQVEGQPSPLAETIPYGVNLIKAQSAWGCSRGKGVRVAVLDTGIDHNHPDLSRNFRGGISFVPGEPTTLDGNGHGTHCAGTIAAAVNGAGVIGVAPAASLFAVKVLSSSGGGAWSSLIAGLDWCIQNGMHIASMSLGAASAPSAVQAMCDLAFQRGVLLVAAAGNSNGPVGAPAHYGSVIAVSAIDATNNKASFSCFGPEVELAAPGVQVLSTWPGGGYQTLSGTSMACPHVAGAAALAWGAHRFADNVTIRRLLAVTADDLGNPGRDPVFGFGRVDADQAAFAFTPPPAVPGLP
jgi:subtilisin